MKYRFHAILSVYTQQKKISFLQRMFLVIIIKFAGSCGQNIADSLTFTKEILNKKV